MIANNILMVGSSIAMGGSASGLSKDVYKRQGMFSIMNYMNPLRGIASMHCSANTDMEGTSSAIFFGLSGTGTVSYTHLLTEFPII